MPNCPVCKSEMVIIVYGEPSLQLFELAKKRKVFLGGCVVDFDDNDQNYHCYDCRKNFYSDLKNSIDDVL